MERHVLETRRKMLDLYLKALLEPATLESNLGLIILMHRFLDQVIRHLPWWNLLLSFRYNLNEKGERLRFEPVLCLYLVAYYDLLVLFSRVTKAKEVVSL